MPLLSGRPQNLSVSCKVVLLSLALMLVAACASPKNDRTDTATGEGSGDVGAIGSQQGRSSGRDSLGLDTATMMDSTAAAPEHLPPRVPAGQTPSAAAGDVAPTAHASRPPQRQAGATRPLRTPQPRDTTTPRKAAPRQ